MACRLCSWLCNRICPPNANGNFWRTVQEWEADFALNWEPAETEARHESWDEADSLSDKEPAAALAIHRELAERGSPFSMLKAGWHYATGRGTKQDDEAAEEFYRRALCAGSWKATIYYASCLFKRNAHDEWQSTLEDGVQKGFIPACFWLAWYRYMRSPKRRTAREVRHLLQRAAEAGHPGARLMLARLTVIGKFGLRQIPGGMRMIHEAVRPFVESDGASADNTSYETPTPSFSATRGNRAVDHVPREQALT